MYYSFQDSVSLYLIMEFLPGGQYDSMEYGIPGIMLVWIWEYDSMEYGGCDRIHPVLVLCGCGCGRGGELVMGGGG